jgi:MFS transporter, DHA2 family, methylenomycin A resistance protein
MMMAGMAAMGAGLLVLAPLPAGAPHAATAVGLAIIGVGLGLNTGPVNSVAVASVPPARSGTASDLVNTARMIGATLGVAVLGAVFAMFAGGVGEGSHIVAGLAPACVGGGIGEMIDAAAAFAFIRRDSLHPAGR